MYVLSCWFGGVCASLYWNTEEYSVIQHLLWCAFASSTRTKNSLQSNGEGTQVFKTLTVSWCHACAKTNYSKAITGFKHWTLFFNYSSAVLDAPPHDVDFKFSPPTKEVTKIDSAHRPDIWYLNLQSVEWLNGAVLKLVHKKMKL